jgi:hypothetical protein
MYTKKVYICILTPKIMLYLSIASLCWVVGMSYYFFFYKKSNEIISNNETQIHQPTIYVDSNNPQNVKASYIQKKEIDFETELESEINSLVTGDLEVSLNDIKKGYILISINSLPKELQEQILAQNKSQEEVKDISNELGTGDALEAPEMDNIPFTPSTEDEEENEEAENEDVSPSETTQNKPTAKDSLLKFHQLYNS